MAEMIAVVGAVASITQLIALGSKVLTRVNDFRSDRDQVPKSFRCLQIDIGVLLQALEHTKTAIGAGHVSGATRDALQPAIDGCRLQIAALDAILAKTLPKSGESWGKFKRNMKAISSLNQAGKVNNIRDELYRSITVLTHHNTAALLVVAGRGHGTSLSSLPCYTLERSPSFYPEQYSVEGLFHNPLFVVAMKQQNYFTHQYYLMFSQTPRHWKRVNITATFKNVRDTSALMQVSTPDNSDATFKELPDAVSKALSTALARIQLFGSVTRVSLPLVEDEGGTIVHESPHIEFTEDHEEAAMSKEADILHNIKLMGCHKFSESEVQVVSRMSSHYFVVRVDGQEYLERRMPFARAGGDGKNGICTFIDDLKLFNSLRGCHGVQQLAGVVLDDAGLHLKSYIYEAPMFLHLSHVFYIANLRSETISWPVRELWATQIAQAVANVHSKGFKIGRLNRLGVGLRADGSASLVRLETSARYLQYDGYGEIPPELRGIEAGKEQCLNDRTDIFQLGMMLWLLADHKGNLTGSKCSRYACTSIPRYKCTAAHSNPTELPPTMDRSVPAYFSSIISRCRSPNPRARPTAGEIVAEILSSQGQHIEAVPQDTLELLHSYREVRATQSSTVHCSECGQWCPDTHYHCYACKIGDFDLCSHCKEVQGIHCYVPEHKLVKRVSKFGGYAQVSS
ncbi:hypothetical protein B0H66DRAFT_110908 [Apodospora peruviana]|uniref:NACHT-NTPase and P-loop NTPases N-terminal domain-containing protein n=1 Tax=Apodospora peruviana TaxID=516989 RepID=A0AAE0MBN8_9PEZI|nr:hypothetical protein B0H66DRAFT_110908 [Apodospora peruviana]